MTKYNQKIVAPSDVANTLNALLCEDKQICYVLPCHEYGGTLVVIVYKEFVQ